MKNIIFATGNKAKLTQINFIVKHFNYFVKIISGRERYGDRTKYEEKGSTVTEIALNGALAVSVAIGKPVITEDTDFCVDALNGEPGIDAGEFLKDLGRFGIIQAMAEEKDRRASINSAVAYAEPDGSHKVFVNKIKGIIAEKEKYGDFPDWVAPNKENKFGGGYNAIFIPDGYDKTLAEISPDKAIPLSYREKNFIDVINYILKK